jgi:hypothetical protein
MTLFREAGDRLRNVRSLRAPDGWWKVAGGVLVCAVLVAGSLSLRRKSKEARLLEALRSRLGKRYGHDVLAPGSGLAEIAERLDNEECRQFARIYYGAVFRDRVLTMQEVALLKDLLRRI